MIILKSWSRTNVEIEDETGNRISNIQTNNNEAGTYTIVRHVKKRALKKVDTLVSTLNLTDYEEFMQINI